MFQKLYYGIRLLWKLNVDLASKKLVCGNNIILGFKPGGAVKKAYFFMNSEEQTDKKIEASK